jgi:hypothetical protein
MPLMGLRTIEQRITATEDFTGVAPTGVFSQANGMERYAALDALAANAVGGLFDFAHDHAIELKQVFVKLGGQTDWTLYLVDSDAVETPLATGTVETYYQNRTLDLIMMPGDKLKLVTTAATDILVARMTIATRIRS